MTLDLMAGNQAQTHLVEINTQMIQDDFTTSGAEQFKRTLNDYADLLYRRARSYGELNREGNSPLEMAPRYFVWVAG